MVIASGLNAAFSKLGLGRSRDEYPYEPYMNPEPTSRLRRVSSHLSVRQRKPSIVETACLSVHKIPAIVAVSGSPDTPTTRARLLSGARPSVATKNPRHSIATTGWHMLVSQDDADIKHAFGKHTTPSSTNEPVTTRTDRSHTTPALIDLPPSYDFRDLDQNKGPHSAPSQETTFRIPNIQVTTAGQRPAETRHHYARPPTTTSYDFTDLDRDSPVALPVPRSSSPSQSSMHRSPSPAVGQSYRSVSPSVGHTPYYTTLQQHDSPLRASHTPPQRSTTPLSRTNFVPLADQVAMSKPCSLIDVDRHTLSPTHDNSQYGAYYCTSPMPIFTSGSMYGTSRGNTYDSRRGDSYRATQGDAYPSTRDTYGTMQGSIYDPEYDNGSPYMTHGQQTGLTSILGEMENYNRAHMSRSVPAPLPSPTATISVDGTLDSPYLDPERDTAFPNSL